MRLKDQRLKVKNSTWSAVDAKIKSSIADAKGGQVVL
jgi:molybdopterin-containing oxidoreductase family iron-sulfur binding subunit